MNRLIIDPTIDLTASDDTYLYSASKFTCESAVGQAGVTASDHWIQAHRVLKPWHEAQATRDVRLTGVNWTTPYAAINGTDALATMESTVQVKQSETGTWKSWTLTNALSPPKSYFWQNFLYFPSKTAKTMSRTKHPVATVLVSLCSPARLYPEFLPSQSH